MSDIIGIGASVYDTLMTVESYPNEDTKMMATSTKIMAGGPVATGIVASAKLGVSASYMGCLGDDVFGNYMYDDFAHWGVGTECVVRKEGVVSFHSVVLLNTTSATRTCVWNKGTIPEITPDELNYDAIKEAKILHLDGHQLTAAIAAAKFAKANGVKVGAMMFPLRMALTGCHAGPGIDVVMQTLGRDEVLRRIEIFPC